MTTESAQKFQERMTKEAVAMLSILGAAMNTAKWEQCVAIIGKAWNIPTEDTARRSEAIVRSKSGGCVYQEADLPMNAAGAETLDNVWRLFETAIQLDDVRERITLFEVAAELAECQNLMDWVMETPEEKDSSTPSVAL